MRLASSGCGSISPVRADLGQHGHLLVNPDTQLVADALDAADLEVAAKGTNCAANESTRLKTMTRSELSRLRLIVVEQHE